MKRIILAALLLALCGPAAASGHPKRLPVIMPSGAKIGTISIGAAGVAKTQFLEGPWYQDSKGHCTSDMYSSPTTFLTQLDHGPGHYPCNALPWQDGTVLLSGHRVTHSTPFDNLGNVRLGEIVRLNTIYGIYLYRVVPPPRGHHYVTNGYGARTAPCIYRNACGVLEMPPKGANKFVSFWMVGWIFRWHFDNQHRLILLACNPKHDLTHRIAVFAKRVRAIFPPTRRR
jgi:hypothetical protein